jgi:hypothetical protein
MLSVAAARGPFSVRQWTSGGCKDGSTLCQRRGLLSFKDSAVASQRTCWDWDTGILVITLLLLAMFSNRPASWWSTEGDQGD